MNSQPKDQTERRHPGQPEDSPGPSPALAVAGTRRLSEASLRVLEAANGVEGSQDGQAYISQSPMDVTVSSPQAVGETGGLSRLPLGPHSQTKDQNLDTFQQKRCPARAGWHKPFINQELRRKGEQRDQTVNKARGISLKEAAQQVREEAKEANPETECPGQMQTDPAPFPEAPASNMEPSSEAKGETSGMELS